MLDTSPSWCVPSCQSPTIHSVLITDLPTSINPHTKPTGLSDCCSSSLQYIPPPFFPSFCTTRKDCTAKGELSPFFQGLPLILWQREALCRAGAACWNQQLQFHLGTNSWYIAGLCTCFRARIQICWASDTQYAPLLMRTCHTQEHFPVLSFSTDNTIASASLLTSCSRTGNRGLQEQSPGLLGADLSTCCCLGHMLSTAALLAFREGTASEPTQCYLGEHREPPCIRITLQTARHPAHCCHCCHCYKAQAKPSTLQAAPAHSWSTFWGPMSTIYLLPQMQLFSFINPTLHQ